MLCALALWLGTSRALARTWTTDDAYISFRYADHLVRGLGLVFNPGERVEGYSNFLWTLWSAFGMRLGFSPEGWANGSSLFCYAAILALLCAHTWSRRRSAWPVPLAALGMALHTDWNNFATGGLETAGFTLLAVSGFVLLASPECRPWRAAAAGLAFALAALTRPDGALFAAIGCGFVAWRGRPRARSVLAYLLPVIAIGIPYVAWKLWYYGDVLPNTYYAKSAGLAWWTQGAFYVGLYFRKYWVLLAGIPLALWAALGARGRPDGAGPASTAEPGGEAYGTWLRSAVLCAALALAYTAYIARIGGDFMYARLLLPVAPFYLLLLELAIERLTANRAWLGVGAGAAAMAALVLTPYPFQGEGWKHGIVNEWELYPPQRMMQLRNYGRDLGRVLAGLPVRIAFGGSEATIVYYSRVPVAIEANTGLTDAFIAHQRLARRGRVGHEKHAPFSYLIDRRRAHFYIGAQSMIADSVRAYVPVVLAQFADLGHTVLTWDPPVMKAILARGGAIQDFPAMLDRYIREMPAYPDSQVRADYERFRRFYFAGVRDPAREAPFLTRLGH